MHSRTSALLATLILALTWPQFSLASTSVNLQKLRKVGETKLRALVGDSFQIEGIYFRDGVANTDSPIIMDLASIFLLAKPKSAELGNMKLAYVASLDGHGDVLLANAQTLAGGKLDVAFAEPLNGYAAFPVTLKPTEIDTQLSSLKASYPSVQFNYLSFIGILGFQTSSVAESISLMADLTKRGLQPNYNAFAYPLPLTVDHCLYVGDGLTFKVVETNDLRTVSAEFLKNGKQFKAPPSLPSELNNF